MLHLNSIYKINKRTFKDDNQFIMRKHENSSYINEKK